MKRGESAGGGQSSLGYLFSPENKDKKKAAPPSPTTTFRPPYGIDIGEDVDDKPPEISPHSLNSKVHGQNYGILTTGRPSIKVKSAPGGDSSLSYLFGDKS